jgi:hypothetical protein
MVDVDGPDEGGGVRLGLTVGVGDGVGVGVGSAVADGVGSAVAEDVGSGVALGTGVGSSDAVGDGEALGSGVGVGDGSRVGVGVTTTPAGVGFSPAGVLTGAAVSLGVGAGVGVTSGRTVPLGRNTWPVCAMNPEAAKTNTPPSRATATIVTTSVPVVLIAPLKTRAGSSASQDFCWCRRRRASTAARMTRSSRSVGADGSGNVASSPISRVVVPSSVEHAGQPRRCSARRRRPAGANSSSWYESISGRAASQSRDWCAWIRLTNCI